MELNETHPLHIPQDVIKECVEVLESLRNTQRDYEEKLTFYAHLVERYVDAAKNDPPVVTVLPEEPVAAGTPTVPSNTLEDPEGDYIKDWRSRSVPLFPSPADHAKAAALMKDTMTHMRVDMIDHKGRHELVEIIGKELSALLAKPDFVIAKWRPTTELAYTGTRVIISSPIGQSGEAFWSADWDAWCWAARPYKVVEDFEKCVWIQMPCFVRQTAA